MKRWKVLKEAPFNPKELEIEQIIAVLLENRGVVTDKDKDAYLFPRLEDVTLESVGISIKEVSKTIKRIKDAISKNEKIVVYGDYDVDGICGTAILWETIYSFYKNVHPYIPHRVDEGYGLSIAGIDNLQETIKKVGLIITVDNGIVAHKAVKYAKSCGIDVIITDHHVAGKILPDVFSTVYTTELCGTGIAYLLAQEINRTCHPEQSEGSKNHGDSSPSGTQDQNDNEEKHLELVALATVADLVPLKKHNRTLLSQGLKKLIRTKRKGLLALFHEAKIKKEEIGVYQIGHMIGPRLNAAGRISHAMDGLRLVCTTDEIRAQKLARTLNEINKERQNLTFASGNVAKEEVQKKELDNILITSSSEYDQGIVGLIASRLVEEFYRPSIAISIGNDISKGSARSIQGVNIIELIRSVPEFLKEAGGHPMAAGFSMETKNLEGFKNALVNKAQEIVSPDLFNRELFIDLELDFKYITLDFFEKINELSPFGMGNPQPVFMTKNVSVLRVNRVGKDSSHMQLLLEKDGAIFKGILFRANQDLNIKQNDSIDVAYAIDKNEWNGKVSIELRVKDIALGSSS